MNHSNFTLEKEVADGLARLALKDKQFDLGKFVNNALQLAIKLEQTQMGNLCKMRASEEAFAEMVKKGNPFILT